jgi:predicted nuclease of predicted toxin-antitoxin system
MKFLIDAQLPARLKFWLIQNGYDALHTDDLPERDSTPDTIIADLADQENRNANLIRQAAETVDDHDW